MSVLAEQVRAAAPPQLLSIVSRRSHGGTNLDIALPLTGNSAIECRRVTALGMQIIAIFDQPITTATPGIVAGTATITNNAAVINGNTVTINLTGVANAQSLGVGLSGITAEGGGTFVDFTIPVRILEGDVNANGTVTASDLNICKARVGSAVNAFTFRADMNLNGSITASDVNLLKARVTATSVGAPASNIAPTIGTIADATIYSGTASPGVEFAIADTELPGSSLGVMATSSDTNIIPNTGFNFGGSGGTRTISITPKVGVTGTVTITVSVGDGLATASTNFNVTVIPGPKLFIAFMTPEKGRATPGSGSSTLLMDGDRKAATIRISHSNLTGPLTAYHVHGPAPKGQDAQPVFDFDTANPEPDGSFRWVFGDSVYTAEQIAKAIEDGEMYINLHTAAWPTGEIRGQYGLAAGSQTFVTPNDPPPLPSGPPSAVDAARFLTQATFGPTMEEIQRVQSIGYEAWIDEQFALPISLIYPVCYERWTTSSAAGDAIDPDRIVETWWKFAITAPDQLRHRVSTALSEILVVSCEDNTINDQPPGLAYYHDTLANNAFGNYRTLLSDVTLHPIMGQFLNMRGNVKPMASNNFAAPNENYAREILQLFSIGLNQLQPDGTLKLSNMGLPIPTYDQSVVQGFAHVFTGWNIAVTPVVIPKKTDTGTSDFSSRYNRPMTAYGPYHSNSAKLLLNNFTIPGAPSHTEASAHAELYSALDNIFNHSNVGPFICRQLIQRMVTSNPSPGYVYRVARAFDGYRTGDLDGSPSGPRGDMKAVIKAILLDYEARSMDVVNNQGFGKIREPLLRATAIIRAFHPTSTSGQFKIGRTDTELLQTIYRAPSVFNFFEPNFIESGEIANFGLYAPELQITSETSTILAHNFLYTGINSAFKGNDVRVDLTTEQNIAGDSAALLDRLNLLMMQNQMPPAMYTRVKQFIDTLPSDTNARKLARAKAAVHLIGTSAQFNLQK